MVDKKNWEAQQLQEQTDMAAAENIRRTAAQAALDKGKNPKTPRTR